MTASSPGRATGLPLASHTGSTLHSVHQISRVRFTSEPAQTAIPNPLCFIFRLAHVTLCGLMRSRDLFVHQEIQRIPSFCWHRWRLLILPPSISLVRPWRNANLKQFPKTDGAKSQQRAVLSTTLSPQSEPQARCWGGSYTASQSPFTQPPTHHVRSLVRIQPWRHPSAFVS